MNPTPSSTSQTTGQQTTPTTQASEEKLKAAKVTFTLAEAAPTGRKHFLMDPRRLALLEAAYKQGYTHDEAALNAGISPLTIQSWLKDETQLRATVDGEEQEGTMKYADVVRFWKGHIYMQAKSKIYKTIVNENSGTTDAWRLLERHQKDEWGLKPGQGSVDGGGAGIVAPELGAESVKRMQEFTSPPPPPKDETQNGTSPKTSDSQTASLIDTAGGTAAPAGGTPVIPEPKP